MSLQRDMGILAAGMKGLLRRNRLLLLTPALIVLGVTAAQLLWRDPLSESLQVSTGEVVGSLLSGFAGANLLDAEIRLRSGELVFCKPYPAWRLLLGRVLFAVFGILCLIGVNSVTLKLLRGLPHPGIALLAAVPPSILLCIVAVAIYLASANTILAYVGPILFWVWSTIGSPIGVHFDRLYNPIFQIAAWSGYLDDPSPPMLETLIANEVTLIGISVLLLLWCCRRVQTAALQ